MLRVLGIIIPLALSFVNSLGDLSLGTFLSDVNQELGILYDEEMLALMHHELQGSDDFRLQAELAQEKLLAYIRHQSTRVAKYKRLHAGDAKQRRQLERVPRVGYDALGPVDVDQLYALAANMSNGYQRLQLCSYRQPLNCSLRLIPDVQGLVQETRDLEEIEYYWLEWRRIAGLSVRPQFVTFMELYKKTAKLNGFDLAEDYWFRDMELSGHQAMSLLNELMRALRPLFLQFHAHVRGSLRKMYGEGIVPRGRPYPQHLSEVFLGKAYRRVQAEWFPDLPSHEAGLVNITEALHRRGLSTTQRVFWNVAEYYRGLGLPHIESSIWRYAQPVATQNEDACWHKFWRFHTFSTGNFTYCPLNDEERFFNMFEAQFNLHYYRAVEVQPTLLQEEPFPNFADALGKCFSLAASSPRYLRKLGLIRDNSWWGLPQRLNRLYIQGLRVIFLLPVFYVLERYRVEVLSGHIEADDNEAFWKLTETYTGAAAPHRRNNDQFDVPSKLLMEVDDQYTSQLLSIVLQFQIYKHLCRNAGQYVPDTMDRPLDLCDLSDQREIGQNLFEAMSLGSSKHYKDILQQLLSTRELSLDGILTYFKPLYDWLSDQNHKNGFEVGWQ